MTKKQFVLIILVLFTQIFVFAGITFYLGVYSRLLIVAICYFVESIFLLHRAKTLKERNILIALLIIPPLLVYLPAHLLYFEQSRISLPSSIANFWGIGCGLAVFYTKGYPKIFILGLFFLVTFYFYFFGYKLWLNKINFNSYSSNVKEKLKHYSFFTTNGLPFPEDSLRHRIVVLDFWETACGVCFVKFPIFQKKYMSYKKYGDVRFYSVNVPLKTDFSNKAVNMLKSNGFDFPMLQIRDINDLKSFQVTSFPTVLILLNGKEIIYRGEVEGIDKYLTRYITDYKSKYL